MWCWRYRVSEDKPSSGCEWPDLSTTARVLNAIGWLNAHIPWILLNYYFIAVGALYYTCFKDIYAEII